jgi:hypothetical protein
MRGDTQGDTKGDHGQEPGTDTRAGAPPGPSGRSPRIELHRLDEAERAWWQGELQSLRRQIKMAWIVGGSAVAMLLVVDLAETPQAPPNPTPPLVASPVVAGINENTAALERRLAEMEVELIRLRAEFSIGARTTPDPPPIDDMLEQATMAESAPADAAEASPLTPETAVDPFAPSTRPGL